MKSEWKEFWVEMARSVIILTILWSGLAFVASADQSPTRSDASIQREIR